MAKNNVFCWQVGGDMEGKRKGIKPVPGDPLKYMNEAQIFMYRRMQAYGWHLKFIRRPLFQRPVCVMTDPKKTALAVLEEDGILNKRPDIQLRSA